MPIASRGSPSAAPEDIALDVVDGLDALMQTAGSNAAPGILCRRGQLYPATNLFYTANGATIVTLAPNGGVCRRFGPGLNQTHAIMTPFIFPIGRDLSLIPPALRVSRLYVWETVFQVFTPLAGCRRFMGLLDDNLQVDGAGGGIGISSISTENAGAWTLKYRLTNGGVLQTGASSGVVPDGSPHAFQLTYRDSLAPALRLNLDGVNLFNVAGLVNLPATDGNEILAPAVAVGSATNPGLGEVAYCYQSRFYVQELQPMPAPV